MIIEVHGAAREVGRAAFVIEEDNKRIVLDYGIKVSSEENIIPLPVQGFIDAVIVSHSHLDHSGAVPLLFKTTEQPVFMTPPSIPMINLLVEDSIKVNKLNGLKPIFSKKHVKRMWRNTIPVGYEKDKNVAGFSFKFHDAGHILGAASIELDTGDRKLVYTGDVKYEDTRLHKAGFTDFKDVDVLMTESTYGDREHPDRKKIEKEFVQACWDVCDEGGNVLVPAFAVGRTQEVIEILTSNGFDYPIFMDGMSKQAAEIMMDFPEYLRDFEEFYKAMKQAEWVSSSSQRKKALEHPSVIVSTAGMLSGGPAVNYLFRMRDTPKPAVFFTGYQPPDSPGYELLNTKRLKYEGFDLNYSEFDIRYFDFSAHTDKHGLFKLVKKTSPGLVIIEHGEEEQANAFAERIEEELGITALVPRMGDRISVEEYL